tara:strand:+ start:58 stop:513 length:456 start_codon:yes stop_codon:yes gene_type:complete
MKNYISSIQLSNTAKFLLFLGLFFSIGFSKNETILFDKLSDEAKYDTLNFLFLYKTEIKEMIFYFTDRNPINVYEVVSFSPDSIKVDVLNNSWNQFQTKSQNAMFSDPPTALKTISNQKILKIEYKRIEVYRDALRLIIPVIIVFCMAIYF